MACRCGQLTGLRSLVSFCWKENVTNLKELTTNAQNGRLIPVVLNVVDSCGCKKTASCNCSQCQSKTLQMKQSICLCGEGCGGKCAKQ